MAEEKEYILDPILENEEMKKMFVGGIVADSKDEDLKTFFEEFGVTVSDHVIIRKDKDKEKKSQNHFGFVTLETSGMVDEVLLKRKELVFNGKNLDVNRAVPKSNSSPGAHEKTKKLFIANLPKSGFKEDELKKYFEDRHDPKYGTIESIQLIKKKDDQGNKTEENKGFGFVIVSSEDMADKMSIQHASFDFKGRKIELKKSVPTTEPGAGRGGRGRGKFQTQGGRGGAQFGAQAYGYGQYGYGDWGGYGGYGAGFDYTGGYGGYGGGYGLPPTRGRGRFTPY